MRARTENSEIESMKITFPIRNFFSICNLLFLKLFFVATLSGEIIKSNNQTSCCQICKNCAYFMQNQ